MRRLLVPHLALWVLGGGLLRVAVVPPEICPPVTAAQAREAAVEGGRWLVRGMDGGGRYTYGYHRDRDEVPTGYNAVRHAAATLSLFLLVGAGEEEFAAAADAGLAHMLGNLVTTPDFTAYAEPGLDPEAGANGLLIAALTTRRDATGDDRYDGLLESLGSFLVLQQEGNGAIAKFWDRASGQPEYGSYGIFATGEAFWGLTLLDEILPAEGWGDEALATARYLALERDAVEGEVTMYPDHWAAYGMAELGIGHGRPLSEELIGYARALAGFFSVRLRVESQRTGEGVNLLVRGWPGPPSGIATAAEGMAALWRLSAVDERLADMRPGMEDDLRCYAGMMVDRQIDAAAAPRYPTPELARGAWFYRDYSQVDDQQHTIAGLVFALPVLEETS